MYCTHCGANNPADATFCQKCGKQLPTTDQDESTILTVPPVYNSNYPISAAYSEADPVSTPPPPPPFNMPSGQAGSTDVPQSLSSAARPKSRRGLIIALVLVVLIVIVAGGAYAYLNRSTPNNTLTTYCNALKGGDYQTAYNQLSTSAQRNLTESQFASFWQNLGGIKSWTLNNVQEQGSKATATVTFTLNSGQTAHATITLINENGTWKVDSETITVS
ncbi:MAG TPA: zinc ribbon domain-containing protein [Ktedonobacteraceae bacterium]|nr:zinc ribbon domain-containing protein [Ktedonobacteraceae bacterium]